MEFNSQKELRPLFEENFVALGGSLAGLKWEECSDGAGSYEVDWGNFAYPEDEDEMDADRSIMFHAHLVTCCLTSWIESAKVARTTPEGYKVVPVEPTEKMKMAGSLVTFSGGNCFDAYRAMVGVAD